ncbi:MAG: hypothetical protein ACI4XF_08780 [Oscillospiraceae bacterium]
MKDLFKTIAFIALAVIIWNAIFPDSESGILSDSSSVEEDTTSVLSPDFDKMLSPVNTILEACIKGDTSIDINELQEWSISNTEDAQRKIEYINGKLKESCGNNLTYKTKIEDYYLFDNAYYKMMQQEDASIAKMYKHYVNKMYFTAITITITGDKGSQSLYLTDINLYNDSGKYIFWSAEAEDIISTLRYHDYGSSESDQ